MFPIRFPVSILNVHILICIQERCDQMIDYIKRLKDCIKWFQQLEANYVSEHEKLKDLLEVAEKKCSDMGI